MGIGTEERTGSFHPHEGHFAAFGLFYTDGLILPPDLRCAGLKARVQGKNRNKTKLIPEMYLFGYVSGIGRVFRTGNLSQ